MPATRPAKKQKRTQLLRPPAPAPLIFVHTSLTSLPFEILADVLLYSCSPYTVLAVSRTCSFLYRTLVQNPAASFIWRGVRSTCKPYALPDPGNRWKGSEADYAAFVFGGGVCEVCQKTTRAMYASFAVRIRLCSSWHCRRKFLKDFLVDVTAKYSTRDYRSLWVPCVENGRGFSRSPGLASKWPNLDDVLVRKTDWEKRRLDIVAYTAERARAKPKPKPADAPTSLATEDESGEGTAEHCNAAIQRFSIIMELSAELMDWKAFYDMEYERVKERNHAWRISLAGIEGWDAEDLAASQTYGSLQKSKDRLLEYIQPDDVLPIRSVIESELLATQARRERQKSEAAYRTKSSEVKKIYECIRCGTMEGINVRTAHPKDSLVLPPLSVFCTLPSVRVLKGSPDPSALSPHSVSAFDDLKSSPLATSLIVSDIHAWFIPVQAHLLRLLGYPNGWQSAGTRILSPVRRVTARFFCRRCGEGKVGRGYRRVLCLDLKGVCLHVCVAPQRKDERLPGAESDVAGEGNVRAREGKKSGKKRGAKRLDWSVDVFETDKKAIRLIETILELRQCSEEQPSTATALNALGDTIRCKTCHGWIVMDFETAIGHAHRHESMEVELMRTPLPRRILFKKDVAAICAPSPTFPISRLAFRRGISELLLGPSQCARTLCNKANYGCKHCFLYTVAGDAIAVGARVEKDGGRGMTFHGLRSHVKEKHGIQDIRDEDVFCYSPIQT